MVRFESYYLEFQGEAERFMRESAAAAATGAKKFSFIYGMRYNRDGGVIIPLDIKDGPIMHRKWMQEYLSKVGVSGAVYTIERGGQSSLSNGYFLKIDLKLKAGR